MTGKEAPLSRKGVDGVSKWNLGHAPELMIYKHARHARGDLELD